MKILKIYSILIIVICILLSFYINHFIDLYSSIKSEFVEASNFENKLFNISEWLSIFTEKSTIDNALVLAEKEYIIASWLSVLFFMFLIFYLLIIWRKTKEKPKKYQYLGLALIIASTCQLYLALQLPFIEIEAFQNEFSIDFGIKGLASEIEGPIYYFYKNKSVLQLISLLFTSKNILVGTALVLFSIVFPLFKLSLTFLILIKPNKVVVNKRLMNFVLKLGKWSMADVFVAAIFLALFAFSNMNSGLETNSRTLLGTYFYIGFVLMSIISGYSLKKQSVKFQES